jgi:hypothetical protein
MQVDDRVRHFQIAREIAARLDTLRMRANEGKSLHEAKDFVAFLKWSGLLSLLETHSATSYETDLPIDGSFLRQKADDVLQLVNDRFRENPSELNVSMTALERLNHKLDLIAGQVAKLG